MRNWRLFWNNKNINNRMVISIVLSLIGAVGAVISLMTETHPLTMTFGLIVAMSFAWFRNILDVINKIDRFKRMNQKELLKHNIKL